MKTLDEYENEAKSQMVEDQTYFTSDVSTRMQILAMKDFLEELKGIVPDFSFDHEGNLYTNPVIF